MSLYFKATVSVFKEVIKNLSILLGFVGLFALNFFIISRYNILYYEALPTASIFLQWLIATSAMTLEVALVMSYREKVKELKEDSTLP